MFIVCIFLTKPAAKDYNDYKLELAFYKQPVFIKNAYQLGEQRANGYHAFLNRTLDIPLYQQLYRYFKENMHRGRIQKGMKLPSKRLLANQLSISQTTVERAYEQLAAEGYIVSKPRSGWFADYHDSDFAYDRMPSTTPIQQEAEENKQWIDFHYGNVDSSYFPFSAWRKAWSIA